MWREGEDNRRDKKEKIVVKDKKEGERGRMNGSWTGE